MFEKFLGIVTFALAIALAPLGTATAAAQSQVAALPCANPALPAAILDGPATLSSNSALGTIRVGAPQGVLTLAVADDSGERELGLMCVTRLRPRAGMLFVFPQSGEWDFWMKNTLISLDMIWL